MRQWTLSNFDEKWRFVCIWQFYVRNSPINKIQLHFISCQYFSLGISKLISFHKIGFVDVANLVWVNLSQKKYLFWLERWPASKWVDVDHKRFYSHLFRIYKIQTLHLFFFIWTFYMQGDGMWMVKLVNQYTKLTRVYWKMIKHKSKSKNVPQYLRRHQFSIYRATIPPPPPPPPMILGILLTL